MRVVLSVLLLAGCSDPVETGRDGDAGTAGPVDSSVTRRDAPVDAGSVPEPISCEYRSDTYGMGAMRLDVPTDSPERLRYTVRGVPGPEVVVAATLSFDTFDADHPGEEGLIWVNDMGPFDVPADPALDDLPSSATVDVTGTTVEGDNAVVFGPGTLMPGTFFEISDVALQLQVRAATCP